MSWRHGVSILVLAVLVGLPVSGAVCALLCESAEASATSLTSEHHTHHGVSPSVESPTQRSAIPGVSVSAARDCDGLDGSVWLTATTGASRADGFSRAVPVAIAATPASTQPRAEASSCLEYYAPLGSAPPTASLVLRV